MADRMLMERLQPSLLDRLTDDAPGERKESAAHRVIDLARLRQIILRDLEWLLNTSNSESERDYEATPHAAASTLNYGIRELTGATATARWRSSARSARPSRPSSRGSCPRRWT